MNIIVAVDNNWGIGNNQQLLYNIPQDMEFFKTTTLNKVVIMGDATLRSLPNSQPLKNRTNLVLSNDYNLNVEGATVFHNLVDLFEHLKQYSLSDIYVIGGAFVYSQLLPYCNFAYVTKIDQTKPADKFFPNLDNLENWELAITSPTFEHNQTKFSFNTYENKSAKTF